MYINPNNYEEKNWRDSLNMYLFHGGCHGCTSQGFSQKKEDKDLSACHNCCYYNADWSLDNLFKEQITVEEIDNEIKRLKEMKIKIMLLGE